MSTRNKACKTRIFNSGRNMRRPRARLVGCNTEGGVDETSEKFEPLGEQVRVNAEKVEGE